MRKLLRTKALFPRKSRLEIAYKTASMDESAGSVCMAQKV